MEERLFDLIIQKRKNNDIVEVPEGKENELLTTDTIVIDLNLASKILTVGQNKNEEERTKQFKEIFNSFKDINGKEYSYDLNDIYSFYFRRHD